MLGVGLGIDKRRLIASGGGYTPAQDTQLFDWWDAQANVTTSGGELTAWSGNVNSENADPPTVTSRPIYGTDKINSLDALTFREADPNYLNIDATTLSSGCTVQIVINIQDTQGIIFNGASITDQYQYQSGSTTKASLAALGNNINTYVDGSLIGNDITRGDLYTALTGGAKILTLENIDLSSVSTLFTGARSDLALPIDAVVADIIISTGNAFITENINFLKDKYGIA